MMNPFRRLMAGLRGLFRKTDIDRELDEELREFLETAVEHRMRTGMTPRASHPRRAHRDGQRGSGEGPRPRRGLGIGGGELSAGPALRGAPAARVAGLHRGRGAHARAWHRRQHGHLHPCRRRPAHDSAGREPRAARRPRRHHRARRETESLLSVVRADPRRGGRLLGRVRGARRLRAPGRRRTRGRQPVRRGQGAARLR